MIDTFVFSYSIFGGSSACLNTPMSVWGLSKYARTTAHLAARVNQIQTHDIKTITAVLMWGAKIVFPSCSLSGIKTRGQVGKLICVQFPETVAGNSAIHQGKCSNLNTSTYISTIWQSNPSAQFLLLQYTIFYIFRPKWARMLYSVTHTPPKKSPGILEFVKLLNWYNISHYLSLVTTDPTYSEQFNSKQLYMYMAQFFWVGYACLHNFKFAEHRAKGLLFLWPRIYVWC